jgi:hypothetical protein
MRDAVCRHVLHYLSIKKPLSVTYATVNQSKSGAHVAHVAWLLGSWPVNLFYINAVNVVCPVLGE